MNRACCLSIPTRRRSTPGIGEADETGVGNIANAPYPPLAGAAAVRTLWEDALIPRIDAFRPQLLLISAGFDAHRGSAGAGPAGNPRFHR